MASQKQVEANRRNAKLGGPKTPEGKARSRLNARKHGIFASALTPMDHEELRGIHDRCRAELQPVGFLEEAIVDKIAAVYLSLQRCALAHAEYHLLTWKQHPCQVDWPRRHPDDRFDLNYFETTVVLVQRYDTTLTNQFLKLIHELQALQKRPSRGEEAPVPGAPAPLRNELAPGAAPSRERPSSRPRDLERATTEDPVAPEAALQNEPNSTPRPALPPVHGGSGPAGAASSRERPSGRPRDLDPATTENHAAPGAALRNEPNLSQPSASQEDADEPLDAIGLTSRRPPGAGPRDPFQPHPRLPYWHSRRAAPNRPDSPTSR
jgi:hypothetical protein